MQLTIDEAIARGESSMKAAGDSADRAIPGWTELALNAIRLQLARLASDATFTMEEMRGLVEPIVPKPRELRAWGAVTNTAVRQGVIVPTGQFRRAASSNGSPKPCYRKGSAGDAACTENRQ